MGLNKAVFRPLCRKTFDVRHFVNTALPLLPALRADAERVVRLRVPDYEAEYKRRGWQMFSNIDRVYVNERARAELGWQPKYDFRFVVSRLKADQDPRSPLARAVGSKGYHSLVFDKGPYPVD